MENSQISAMRVPSSLTVFSSSSPSKTAGEGAQAKAAISSQPASGVRTMDPGNVSAKELGAWLDDMIFSGQMSVGEAGKIFGAIPSYLQENDPDRPFSIMATLEGIRDFDADSGDESMAAMYTDLIEKMNTMRAQMIRVSVVA